MFSHHQTTKMPMQKIRLGRTNLEVSRSSFGAIPIQRINQAAATALLRKAYDHGINFFDTARGYTDSEEKIGQALHDVRHNLILATKSPATTKQALFQDLSTSLRNLQTDYIDILQVHNPAQMPRPDDANELYQGLLEHKAKGQIRFIGLTNHRLAVAVDAIASNLYDTLQFPLNYLSTPAELDLSAQCQQHDLGLIAMKALSGGLITNAAAAFAFLRQYDNVVPIWGIEREVQLDEFLALEQTPPILDDTLRQVIAKDQRELAGGFCRGCGYCLPCPAEIPIPFAARMALLLRRMPYQQFLTDEWKLKMARIEQCQECGQCRSRCPYKLDPPTMLQANLHAYREFYQAHEANPVRV